MTNDNIVTLDAGSLPGRTGDELQYTITFSREDKLHAPDNAYVMQTRRSTGDEQSTIRQLDGHCFHCRLHRRRYEKLPADTPVAARAEVPAITLKC